MVEKYRMYGAEVIVDNPYFDIDPFFILRLKNILLEKEVQIFHAHELKPVVNGLIAAALAGCKARIAHIHSPINGWQIPLYKKIPNLIINFLVVNSLANKVIALTEEIKKDRLGKERIWEEKVVVIPNGIEINRFAPHSLGLKSKLLQRLGLPPDYHLIGTLSRLSEEKGIDIFIRSVAEFLKSRRYNHPVHFVIAGDGHLRGDLEALVLELGLSNEVSFLGFLEEEDYLNYYGALDLFVFPTLHEGFGYVLAEAMSAEALTISSDLPVLRELTVQGKYGFHFKKGNPAELAIVLNQVLNLPKEKLASLRKIARAHVIESYSMEIFSKRYRDLYAGLLAPQS